MGDVPQELGYSVAMSADGLTLVVGAPAGENDPGDVSGIAYVYDWNEDLREWISEELIEGEREDERFGAAVAMSADGKRIAVGAPAPFSSGIGLVRVFDRSGTNWVQVGSDIVGSAGDRFGWSVAMSANGDRIVIGAPSDDDALGADMGSVSVFELVGSVWTSVGARLVGEGTSNHFGSSVAMSADGTRLAVGAWGNDANKTDFQGTRGHVRVFGWADSAWTRIGGDIDGLGERDEFGSSVAVSEDGSRLAVSSPGGNNYDGFLSAPEWVDNQWVFVGGDIDAKANEYYGQSLSMSADGDRIASGGPYAAGQQGIARVHDLMCESGLCTWEQVGEDIVGVTAGDRFGWSVALSADGKRLAVGAPWFDRPANNIESADLGASSDSNEGKVRVYLLPLDDTPPPPEPPTPPDGDPDPLDYSPDWSLRLPAVQELPDTGGTSPILPAIGAVLILAGLALSTRRRITR
jgi:LPXTG-motif cell wall-anchored protein